MAAKILVVDDDPAVTHLLTDSLTMSGYEVVCAADGYSALNTFVRHKPQLLILDYHLPAGDGCDVLQRIRARVDGADVPVIFLTATPLSELKYRVHLSPSLRYLSKPIVIALLLQTIRELLGPAGEPATNMPPPPVSPPPARPIRDENEPTPGDTVLDLDADDGATPPQP